MTADRVLRGHAARLSLWNRLFHGLPVGLDELDFLTLCGDPSSPDERAAYVTLKACANLTVSGRQAVRCALRIAILYWFSNVGGLRGSARPSIEPKRSTFHIAEALGTGLTWDEAVASMRRKPIDFSGYLAILELVEGEYRREWQALFPSEPPASIATLRGSIRDSGYASGWRTGPDDSRGGHEEEGV
jgi:hypothetical protein